MNNFILMTDGYKLSHFNQYPKRTEKVYSYLEARSNRHMDETVFFGLKYYLNKYMTGSVVSKADVINAKHFFKKYMPNAEFNEHGWNYIVNRHGGRLPLEIKAVDEGTVVPTGNVLMTIENTDPNCFWLTNYVETLLMKLWYPITVASQSFYLKKKLLQYHELSSDESIEAVDFKLHDFGYRGVSSEETAAIGSAAHLLSFKGTDTIAGISLLEEFYPAEDITLFPGYSIPASEHSTITSWQRENEVDAFRNMLIQYPTGLVACVSDSYNIYEACSELWGNQLKDEVLNRNGTLVIRPDSGNPSDVLNKILPILAEKFGYTYNSKAFKVLNPKVRVIQGDGIDRDSIKNILEMVVGYNKWSLDNLSFGSGGGLLQKLDRDTMGFAIKCSSVTVNGEERDVYKEPVGGSKTSKKGKLCLLRNGNNYGTFRKEGNLGEDDNVLRTVFYNGDISFSKYGYSTGYDKIRKRIHKSLMRS